MNRTLASLIAAALILPSVASASFDRDLSYGSKGDDVSDLQTLLTKEGLYSGPITGNFLSLTRAAVAAFQSREGIVPAAGYFGPMTRAKINGLEGEVSEDSDATTTAPATITARGLAEILAQIEFIQREISRINALQGAPTEQTSVSPAPTPNSSPSPLPAPNPTPVPPAPVPTSSPATSTAPVPPVILTPQVLIKAPQSIEKGNTRALIAEIQVSNLDEAMKLPEAITAFLSVGSTFSGWNPGLFAEYRGSDIWNAPAIPAGQTGILRIYAGNVPNGEGTITLQIESFRLLGQNSGSYRSAAGVPFQASISVL